MRRLLHAISNVLAAMCLLLAVLVAALWVRSYWWLDTVQFGPLWEAPSSPGREIGYGVIETRRGLICFVSMGQSGIPATVSTAEFSCSFRTLDISTYPPHSFNTDLIYRWKVSLPPGALATTSLQLPLWVFLTVLLVIPAVAGGRFVRRRRRGTVGLCRVCGYDLRASPELCPECGAGVSNRALAEG